MDERRARIHDDLRGAIGGDLLFEPLERAPYARDASLYEIDPVGVVVPRTETDVVNTVKFAAENGLPVHARGAGTSKAGGNLGPGLVLDFSTYLRRVVDVQPERVVVQPGAVVDDVNAALAPFGRRLGPDPDRSDVRTIGGLVGLDASGPCSLRYGTTGDHVDRLRVVFASGDCGELGQEPWPGFEDEPIEFKAGVVRKLGAIVRRNLDVLARKGQRTPANSAGYALAEAATGAGIHLPRLITGSEGTLALVTEVTLRTIPIPAAQAAVLLPFAKLWDAAESASFCRDASPSACDLYDWRSIHLAREASPLFREWIDEAAESVLVLLFEGDDPDEATSRARMLADRVARRGRLAADPVICCKRHECDRMLGLRRAVEPLLMRMAGRARAASFIDDVAVPTEQLPSMIQHLQEIMKAHDLSWTLDAHAGQGQLHARPFLDLSDPNDVAKLEPVASAVYEAALSVGGSIASAGGCGLARTQFLRRQFGDLVSVFRDVKDAFDPVGVLNPGKIVGEDPHLMTQNLRRNPSVSAEVETPHEAAVPAPIVLPLLRWNGRGPVEAASDCNGCGVCRSGEPTLRMCPTFRAVRAERASPRAKANLLRQIAAGEVEPKYWGSEELKRNADLCVHCNLCPTECPSGVDVSSLMLEAKAAYVENHGLSPGDWGISRVELWSRIASRFPTFSNVLLASKTGRWFLERLIGLSRLRRLP